MSLDCDNGLAEELELLHAMWPSPEELQVRGGTPGDPNVALTLNLMPLTAGETRSQFVRLELLVELSPSYPEVPPSISIGGSRGLTDERRADLLAELRSLAETLVGEPALYALFEAAREMLTAFNAPAGECAICLGELETSSEAGLLRTPCFHAFHTHCFAEFWQCERDKQAASTHRLKRDPSSDEVACPECRASVRWAEVPQLHTILDALPSLDATDNEQEAEELDDQRDDSDQNDFQYWSRACATAGDVINVAPAAVVREEAFIRLHHLLQGNDVKEKPLLRLLKEMDLDAVVFYGKPAMLHLQGEAADVDAFVGTAKRRHITITIQVAQRSRGPAIAKGVTAVGANKGSLDGEALKAHLEKRGLGETSFTIVGS
eukprot:gnl/TRDRNA2_/TRDRNA2_80888_c0_seq1.p1 gnl/TRDRNA2_/TRDRNA2_80888_c0~~gnl/TRDRNA2_/TRDRNA2_80888_c0_seq1.p1  ORF type:complete len:377 (+),score=76.56 gnl/TRDRNA2_/TRDRNA2_80888_c0_seq1:52-1182(+)